MNWEKLKSNIYYLDGSLRDIYVLNITRTEWNKWIDYVNRNYNIEFYNGQNQKIENLINKNIVFDFWDEKTDLINNVTVKIGDININCYFFGEFEFENDICPMEIKSIDEHDKLINYLKDISRLFNKKAFLTLENSPDYEFVSIENGKTIINI